MNNPPEILAYISHRGQCLIVVFFPPEWYQEQPEVWNENDDQWHDGEFKLMSDQPYWWRKFAKDLS